MADDRTKNNDLDKNMGGASKQNQGGGYGQGQQSPGRNLQDDELSTGQRGAGKGHEGEQQHMKDDFGTSGNSDVNEGGRNL